MAELPASSLLTMTDVLASAPAPTAPDRGAVPLVTDDELTALALRSPMVTVADDDAVNYWDIVEPRRSGLLPEWYMPSASAGVRRLTGWRRRIVWLVIVAIALINAAGLCITYGHVTLG